MVPFRDEKLCQIASDIDTQKQKTGTQFAIPKIFSKKKGKTEM